MKFFKFLFCVSLVMFMLQTDMLNANLDYELWFSTLNVYIKKFPGKVGIHAFNIKTGQEINHNANEFFPMASTCKIILATYIFDQIDQQKLNLEQAVTIESKDIVPGSGIIKDEFLHNKLLLKQYSMSDLLHHMMVESDNTAADTLMVLGGGHQAVDRWLQNNKVKDIHFGTDLKTWLKGQALKTLRYKEAQDAVAQSKQAPRMYKALSWLASLTPEPKTIDFSNETTNIAKPAAFNKFLGSVYEGTAPGLQNKKHHAMLLGFMKDCKTGHNRIPKHLLDATILHKTGSGIMGVCNDAGIIERENKDPIVLTIFLKDSVKPLAQMEEAISDIALCINNCLQRNITL